MQSKLENYLSSDKVQGDRKSPSKPDIRTPFAEAFIGNFSQEIMRAAEYLNIVESKTSQLLNPRPIEDSLGVGQSKDPYTFAEKLESNLSHLMALNARLESIVQHLSTII